MSAAHSIPDVLVSKITLMAYKLSPHPCAVMVMDYKAKLMDQVLLCRNDYDLIFTDDNDLPYDDWRAFQSQSMWYMGTAQSNSDTFFVTRGATTTARNKQVCDFDDYIILKTPDYPPKKYGHPCSQAFWTNRHGW